MKIFNKILHSKLFQDSFWSVFGNGLGSAFLLAAGILIARILGSEMYGEYGVVKSTMFSIAALSSFGLGISSTKYVAQYVAENKKYLCSLISSCYVIAVCSSSLYATVLLIFAAPLSEWLDTPGLVTPFRFLGIIIVCRSINLTQIGILSGLKKYQASSTNSIISGLFMLIICMPLTYTIGLSGALASLLFSQILNCLLNRISIRKYTSLFGYQETKPFIRELLKFSFPIALQDSSDFVGNWGGLLILTKLSSIGEVGIYTAASQWNAVIIFIPSILYNVVISHLSSHLNDRASQVNIMKIMLLANLGSTLIALTIIWLLSGCIVSLYGESFEGIGLVLTILTGSTIFICCSNVFRSHFVANGKNWILLAIRTIKDFFFLGVVYVVVKYNNGSNASVCYAWAYLITNIAYCLTLFLYTISLLHTPQVD